MPATSLLRWAWVAVLVGCRAAPEVPAPPPKGSLRPFGIPLDAPAAPWDGRASKNPPGADAPDDVSVRVGYDLAPGTLIEARDAWSRAAQAQGWRLALETEEPEDSFDWVTPLDEYEDWAAANATLWKPGFNLTLNAWGDTADQLTVAVYLQPERFTDPSWPEDPFCPPVSRLDPEEAAVDVYAPKSQRVCYLSGANRLEHGPAEWSEGGQVVKTGQYDHGHEVGTWTERWKDVDGKTYDQLLVHGDSPVDRWVDPRRRVVVAERSRTADWSEVWRWPQTGLSNVDANGKRDPRVLIDASFGQSVRGAQTLEVLAVDPVRSQLAVRVSGRGQPKREAPCLYADDQGQPQEPLILVLWRNGEEEEHKVRYDAWEPEWCTTPEAAESAESKARNAAAAAGLNFDVKTRATAAVQVGDRSTLRFGDSVIGLVSEVIQGAPIARPENAVCHHELCVVGRWVGVEAGPLAWGGYDMTKETTVRLVEGWEDSGAVVVHWQVFTPGNDTSIHGFTAFQDGRVVAPGAR